MIQLLLTLVVGTTGGLIARKFKLPAAFMTGSMIAVAIVAIMSGDMFMPRTFKLFAQIVSGAFIGQQVSKEDLKGFPQMAKGIILLMTFFTINTFFMGTIFHFFFGMDYMTALLSCLPGGIMDVSLMSIDMGAQPEIVATMQLARLVCMLIILPYWIKFLLHKVGKAAKNEPESITQAPRKKIIKRTPSLKNNGLILLVSGIGGVIGIFLAVPVGALIFSLIFSFILKLTKNTAPLSNYIRYIAQILAGSIIGSTFSKDSVSQLGQLIVPIILLLSSYLVINVLFAYIAYKGHLLDLKSALFASSPAGATDISLIAGELGGNLSTIAGIQISRTLYVVVILPNLIQLFLAKYLAT